MRKLLFILIFFISVDGWAQPGDTIKKNQDENKLITDDSVLVKPGKLKDSVLNTPATSGSNAINENFDRNITNILELQKGHRAREKRNAMIRIGIGIAFLIILIIGLRKKRVKK